MAKLSLVLVLFCQLIFAHRTDCKFSTLQRLAQDINLSLSMSEAFDYLERSDARSEIKEPSTIRFIGENGTLQDAIHLNKYIGKFGIKTDHVLKRAIDQIRILNGIDPYHFPTLKSESPFLKTFNLDGYNTIRPDVLSEKIKENEKFLTPEDLAYFTALLPFRGHVATILKDTQTPFILPLDQKGFFLGSLRAKLLAKEGLSSLENIIDTVSLSNKLKDEVKPSDIEMLGKFGEAQDIPTLTRIKFLFELCKQEKDMADRHYQVSQAIDSIKDRNKYSSAEKILHDSKRSILVQLGYYKKGVQNEFSDTSPLYLLSKYGTEKEIPILEKILKTYQPSSETYKMAQKVLYKLKKEDISPSKIVTQLTDPLMLTPQNFIDLFRKFEPYLTADEITSLAARLPWHNRLVLSQHTLKDIPPYTEQQKSEILRNVKRYFVPSEITGLLANPHILSYIKFMEHHGDKEALESLKTAGTYLQQKKPFLGPILKEAVNEMTIRLFYSEKSN